MNEFVQKIKYYVQSVSRQQGIKGLIKLQNEVPENMKFKCRLATLHLMQMCHDWEGIRKLVVEWKMLKSFGKQLVIRMRKRVGQEPGFINEDNDIILKQLDRLNQKNWRQFSPKKSFPDYIQYLYQNTKKESSNIAPTKIVQPKKQEKIPKVTQEKETSQISKQGSTIFSKLAQFQKNQKFKEKQTNHRGVFSKQFFKTESAQSLQQKKKLQKPALFEKDKQKKQVAQIKNTIQPKKLQKPTFTTQIKNTQYESKPTTPLKQASKKIISLKYGNQKQATKQQFKDSFSFSAVKAKQQFQGISHKATKGQQLDNSFLNFTNQSRIIKDKNQIVSQKKQNILEEFKLQEPFLQSQTRYNQNKPLFTQQQLNLIQPHIPPKNYIRNILNAQGINAVQMLRKQLSL